MMLLPSIDRRLKSPSWFRRAAAAAAMALLAAGVVRAAGVQPRIQVQGRIVSADGQAMPGWPVQIIGTQRFLEIRSFTSGGEVAILARATTDENGYFSIDIPRERGYHYWFARFADPKHLDPIRYLAPEDLEISYDIKRNRVARADITIRTHPDWPQVERMIVEAGGPATQRGGILKALGLPEKIVAAEAGGDEEWWYFTKGIVYTFRDGEPIGSRRFEPVPAPPASAGAQGGA